MLIPTWNHQLHFNGGHQYSSHGTPKLDIYKSDGFIPAVWVAQMDNISKSIVFGMMTLKDTWELFIGTNIDGSGIKNVIQEGILERHLCLC